MILIDTTPLVALCDQRDSHHKRAVRQLETLARSTFVTCDAVLTEACFHLPHQSQRLRLRDLLDELAVESLPATSERSYRDDVFNWLTRFAEHEPDWADACLAVACGRNSAAKVWTYDSEFRTIWRRPDGTRIPLVTP